MNVRLTMATVLMLGLLFMPIAHAEPPTNVQIEVNFLLNYIGESGCEFYRNGTWRDSKAAQAHIRDKYEYLEAINLIDTTEDFIKWAATKSSFSGQPYKVRCNGGASVTSNQWLREELVRFRNKKPASILLEPKPARVGVDYSLDAPGLARYLP